MAVLPKTWIASGAAFASGVALTVLLMSSQGKETPTDGTSSQRETVSKTTNADRPAPSGDVARRAWSDPSKPVSAATDAQGPKPPRSAPPLVFDAPAPDEGAKGSRGELSRLPPGVDGVPRSAKAPLVVEETASRSASATLGPVLEHRQAPADGSARIAPQGADRPQAKRVSPKRIMVTSRQSDGTNDRVRAGSARVPPYHNGLALEEASGPGEKRPHARLSGRSLERSFGGQPSQDGYRTASYPQRGYLTADLSRYPESPALTEGRRAEAAQRTDHRKAAAQTGVMRWLQEP
ncbi:hypothetical protein OCOJLMKI_0635 [Methylobacterium iners]|uniref:Uncharacterized protein n=1 Tax=Methylobacterium iners TaxID=418707 RepID=A0ABQ4RRN7_9HYPH|nr:hypothetical protein OCOJLMKI_0635 [Methylobacterium iners]